MKIKLDIILIQFGPVLNGTWHNGRRNVLTGSNLEKMSKVHQTKTKSNKRDQEGRTEKLHSHDH